MDPHMDPHMGAGADLASIGGARIRLGDETLDGKVLSERILIAKRVQEGLGKYQETSVKNSENSAKRNHQCTEPRVERKRRQDDQAINHHLHEVNKARGIRADASSAIEADTARNKQTWYVSRATSKPDRKPGQD
eukprot:CAMPEP_0181253410 /NCGR_PEP_ID=MMETSP1096-20121128/47999_1 /TAXON_ID=156174 ORGANISM="Chrysochromulina ericina, Strain CCMP281" /NCGR_SAMPLE_ID=MMETSP1096 /ASSEMBLY_ACC=CAM_ASM_000453 /LENGTH=134 /DNA_ID=CAMNT_0023351265 /DNA_START=585 /DNA_END=991 /DNA_ORIENTATION=-